MADDDLAFAGAARQLEQLDAKEISSRELVQLCLDRIQRHDGRLNAFRVVLAEPALDAADAADKRRRSRAKGKRPPLLGLPIAIKDDMDVKGEVTTKGSIAHGGPAKTDAKLVRLLREAGAVVVGKTNVPELMTMPFTETTWYGATRNPWDLDRTPGGSSGGSGAAVAAGLVPVATGSDGAGSIRIPAACCGLVGLKPQRGRVPTPSPDWTGLSTYGFLARTVRDTALLHDAIGASERSFTEAIAQEPRKRRIAWSVKVPLGVRASVDSTQRRAVESMVHTLEELGHDVARIDPDLGLAGTNLVTRYLAGIADDARGMAARERLGRRSKGLARLGGAIPQSLVQRAIDAARSDRERIARIFEQVDVLMLPLFTRMPLRIGEVEGYGTLRTLDTVLAYTPFPGLFNHTDLPALAVPTDATQDGLPLGVQLVGPPDSEAELLALAAQLEQAVGWPDRRPAAFEA
jgi:amidase